MKRRPVIVEWQGDELQEVRQGSRSANRPGEHHTGEPAGHKQPAGDRFTLLVLFCQALALAVMCFLAAIPALVISILALWVLVAMIFGG